MNPLIPTVNEISLITPDRLQNLCDAAQLTTGLDGDMAELGVYRGGSALIISELFPWRTLHLFDTFSGLPYTEEGRYNPTKLDLNKGRFACTAKEVRKFLGNRNVRLYEGLFPSSANGMEALSFSFVHIDCDLYQSAKDAILWFAPKMVSGGVMFFDDYGCDFTGVTEAVHEFFNKDEVIKQTPFGCYIKK